MTQKYFSVNTNVLHIKGEDLYDFTFIISRPAVYGYADATF